MTPTEQATAALPARRPVDLARSGPWFAGMLLLALVAFWPTYLSRLGVSSGYTHVHAILATMWLSMLIAQPVLVRRRNLDRHRALGRFSYALAPAIVISVVLLAHSRITGLEGEAFGIQSYVLWLQVSLVGLFALSYGLAVATRRTMALHARFMICTGLTLIDPIVIRVMFWADATPTWNYQWLTFGLTDLVLVTLIWLERDAPRGRWVFPTMLVVFVLAQLPALLQLTATAPWQAFAHWFAGLPLT